MLACQLDIKAHTAPALKVGLDHFRVLRPTRDLLAPIYGWFTEGFKTRDLKEANALLSELV
jgi:hypothetical protein